MDQKTCFKKPGKIYKNTFAILKKKPIELSEFN